MSIFEYSDYRDYMRAELNNDVERGARSKLAAALRCQNSFISQILKKTVHLSFDHAILAADFFNLTTDRKAYFMNLVQLNRAGSKQLEDFYRAQLTEIKSRQLVISERIKPLFKITKHEQAIYYSNWWYASIHIMTALPEFSNPAEISSRLALPFEVIENAIEFLVNAGFIEKKSGKLSIGKARIHIEAKSPLASRHHANWRIHAAKVAESANKENLHYSSVIGISKKDAIKIKHEILNLIEKSEAILKDSKEEAPYIFLMDFYGL
jgi:uncharacterized protein (TIGR02147 family)